MTASEEFSVAGEEAEVALEVRRHLDISSSFYHRLVELFSE